LKPFRTGVRSQAPRPCLPAGRDDETITRITNAPTNREKSVESFFEICVIREPKVVSQSSPKKTLTSLAH
jgi:hypothetical protein